MISIVSPAPDAFLASGTTVQLIAGVPRGCRCEFVGVDSGADPVPWVVPSGDGCAIAEMDTPTLLVYGDQQLEYGGEPISFGETRISNRIYAVDFFGYMPEFSDPVKWPHDTVNLWMGFAGRLLNRCAWGELLPDAVRLLVAHNLVLGGPAGGLQAPGTMGGYVTSKSVDKVSVGLNPSLFSEDGAGFWNSTTYGRRLWQMARMLSMGGIYVGGMPNIRRHFI